MAAYVSGTTIPSISIDRTVYLHIAVPPISMHPDGQDIYHYSAMRQVVMIGDFILSALARGPYRLENDMKYVDGKLRLEIVKLGDSPQADILEADTTYRVVSETVTRAINYLIDPVQVVTEGLKSGEKKIEFQNLYQSSAEIVAQLEGNYIEAAVSLGSEKRHIASGLVTYSDARIDAKRLLHPPVERELEQKTVFFVAQDSDGMLLASDSEHYFFSAELGEIPLNEEVVIEAHVKRTPIRKDAHRIVRVVSDKDESNK